MKIQLEIEYKKWLLPEKKKEQEIVIKSKPKPVEEDDFDPDDIDFEKALEDFEENK